MARTERPRLIYSRNPAKLETQPGKLSTICHHLATDNLLLIFLNKLGSICGLRKWAISGVSISQGSLAEEPYGAYHRQGGIHQARNEQIVIFQSYRLL